MPSGADLEYAQKLNSAGISPSAAAGYDGARLEQLALEGSVNFSSPSYAGPLTKPYDAATGIYNWRVDNMRRTHAGLIRALNGGKMNIVSIGDSHTIGHVGGGAIDESVSYPRKIATTLGARLSLPVGSGIVPVLNGASSASSRWSSTGSWVTFAGVISLNPGSTCTYSSIQTGTQVDIYYLSANSAFTYQIDGGGAVGVTPPGGYGVTKLSITGLANTTHTVKINGSASVATYVCAVRVGPATGIEVHGIGYGGSVASPAGAYGASWTDGNSTGIGTTRNLIITASGMTPDLVTITLGANDMAGSQTVENAIAGLRIIRNWYPNSDCLLVASTNIIGTSDTRFDSYMEAQYALAGELDIPLMDLRARMGTGSEAQAYGLWGADNAHANPAMNAAIGRNIATRMLTTLGGLQDV